MKARAYSMKLNKLANVFACLGSVAGGCLIPLLEVRIKEGNPSMPFDVYVNKKHPQLNDIVALCKHYKNVHISWVDIVDITKQVISPIRPGV